MQAGQSEPAGWESLDACSTCQPAPCCPTRLTPPHPTLPPPADAYRVTEESTQPPKPVPADHALALLPPGTARRRVPRDRGEHGGAGGRRAAAHQAGRHALQVREISLFLSSLGCRLVCCSPGWLAGKTCEGEHISPCRRPHKLPYETHPNVRRLVDQLESLAPSVPSLFECRSLAVKGPVRFEGGVAIRGDVALTNSERLGGCPGAAPRLRRVAVVAAALLLGAATRRCFALACGLYKCEPVGGRGVAPHPKCGCLLPCPAPTAGWPAPPNCWLASHPCLPLRRQRQASDCAGPHL